MPFTSAYMYFPIPVTVNKSVSVINQYDIFIPVCNKFLYILNVFLPFLKVQSFMSKTLCPNCSSLPSCKCVLGVARELTCNRVTSYSGRVLCFHSLTLQTPGIISTGHKSRKAREGFNFNFIHVVYYYMCTCISACLQICRSDSGAVCDKFMKVIYQADMGSIYSTFGTSFQGHFNKECVLNPAIYTTSFVLN